MFLMLYFVLNIHPIPVASQKSLELFFIIPILFCISASNFIGMLLIFVPDSLKY